MAHHHQLLDDDELRMSLDDDMRALEALDVDVDMDGLQEHEHEQDGNVDVFRPSAMLDRRMEEEFGSAFYSTCFQASELVEKDLDGGFVDIEQMLLSESEEFLTAHFANTSDELLHEQLLHGERGNAGDSEQQQRMIRAELTARHFLHAQSNGNGATDQQQRLVLLKQAIASSSLSSSSIFNMPPKYFEGGVQSSPQKRRVHRRTFGERTQPFAFGTSNDAFAFKGEGQAAQASNIDYHQHNNSSSRSEATVSDENSPPPPPSDEVRIKEEIVADTGVTQAHTVTLEMTELEAECMDEDHNDDEQKATAAIDSRAQTPVTFTSFTGFRSISDDHHQDDAAHEEEALRTMLQTPLRRSLSSPAPSQAAEQFTPQQQQLSGGYASRSMSPADAFEKVAVVVQVVKDSPGRVDKFEWRIGSTQQQSDEKKAKKRPNLSTQLGTADASLNDDQAFADSQQQDTRESSTSTATAALPPRYFRGVTSSPQKRRVHSTTFGSFARSFSFTGSAPPSDL
ncbi:hypothetical protein Gpo141_00006666 [Globisporangium polare]